LPESSARVAKERVSGAVIASHDPAKVRVEHSLEFPAVYLLTAVEGRSAVLVDDYGGGWRAAEMLIEFGHRRIAFLILPGPIIAARVNGYRDALELAGIQVEDAWIRSISAQWTSDDHVSGGRRGMTAWLHDGWRELGCTAIVVFNDSVAIGAMQALQAAGISVPGDVSVIGFDGTEICQHVFPALTSVRIPLDELGRAAVNLLSGLLELAAGKPLDPQIVTLPVEIAMGGTVAPPRDRL